jgi:hypothetical protein
MITIRMRTDFVLTGNAIRVKEVKVFYEDNTRKPVDTIVARTSEYPLVEAMPETVRVMRKSGQPGFVYKKDGKLLCAAIPQIKHDPYESSPPRLGAAPGRHMEMRTAPAIEHCCNDRGMMCNHLSALPDEMGGCAKVRARKARIEDYSFIAEGYEFFNVHITSLVVLKCAHWDPNYDAAKVRAMKKEPEKPTAVHRPTLQYAWPDFGL